jgi:hypothetical protein
MIRSLVVATVAGAIGATTAHATPVFVGFITVADSYGSTGGGEFRASGGAGWSINANSTGTAFQFGNPATPGMFETFCLEKFESLPFDITNYKADLNTETVSQASAYASGNLGGFYDALDARTAYLYHHFLAQTLTTPYDYVNEGPRIDDSNALQTAIWFIEQEDASALSGKALDLYNEANAAVSSGAWVGIGNVRILNIYTNTARADYQDLLVELVTIPLPSAAAMAGVGLAGFGFMRRRR